MDDRHERIMDLHILALAGESAIGFHRIGLTLRGVAVQPFQGGQGLLPLHFHHAAGEQHIRRHAGDHQLLLRRRDGMLCLHFGETLQVFPLVLENLADAIKHRRILCQQQCLLVYPDRPPFHLHGDAQCLPLMTHNHPFHLYSQLIHADCGFIPICPQSYPQYPQFIGD